METTAVALPETLCSRCGYNLQGLDAGSNCPECGQAIELTLTFGLEHSQREWLRGQARTMLLLLALPLVQYTDPRQVYRYGIANTIIAIAIVAVGTWGCWRLSAAEPGREASDAQSSLARGVRVCSIAFAAIFCASFVRQRFGELSDVLVYVQMGALALLNWLVGALVLILARRSGRTPLTAHARLALWLLPLSPIVRFLIGLPIAWSLTAQDIGLNIYITVTWLSTLAVFAAVPLFGRMHEVLLLVADGVPVASPKSQS